MQKPFVMAFRKRLKKRGYTDVSICERKDMPGSFVVVAVEPLSGMRVTTECSYSFMLNSFRF